MGYLSSSMPAYNGRLFDGLEEERQPIAMMCDWQWFDIDGWLVPTGGKNVDSDMDVLQLATDT